MKKNPRAEIGKYLRWSPLWIESPRSDIIPHDTPFDMIRPLLGGACIANALRKQVKKLIPYIVLELSN